MLGHSKPIPFDPYGSRRRSRKRFPGWLLLLLSGIAIGAGGVLYVQERHLPPRLSAAESTRLQDAYAKADTERERLQRELADTSRRLQAALADKKQADAGLESTRAEATKLREELRSVVGLFPTDPRGGAVEVRAGQFEAKGGRLAYGVVLTLERPSATPVAGHGKRGKRRTPSI